MEELFAQIDAEPARRQAALNASPSLGSRISEFFASLTPRTLALASGAAVLAILVQAGFIAGMMLNETKPGGYQTASAPTTAQEAGTFALVRFAPQASAADVTKIYGVLKRLRAVVYMPCVRLVA